MFEVDYEEDAGGHWHYHVTLDGHHVTTSVGYTCLAAAQMAAECWMYLHCTRRFAR